MPEFDSTIQFRDVDGFPGYKVGSDGSVWSCRPGNGKGGLRSEYRQMQPRPDRAGYFYAHFRGASNKNVAVHALVLNAFVGPCPEGMQCRHFPDDCKANNNLSNLQWGTPSANQRDRQFHGTDNSGERHGASMFTESQVLEIRELVRSGKCTQAYLVRKYKCSKSCISCIILRKSWKHI